MTSTLAPSAWPMSTMVFQPGCCSGLHMIVPGLMSMGVATERVGVLAYGWAAC